MDNQKQSFMVSLLNDFYKAEYWSANEILGGESLLEEVKRLQLEFVERIQKVNVTFGFDIQLDEVCLSGDSCKGELIFWK